MRTSFAIEHERSDPPNVEKNSIPLSYDFAILLVVIMKNKQTVYLKPKSNGSPKKSEGEIGAQSSSQSSDFNTTQAYENDDVKRSELK